MRTVQIGGILLLLLTLAALVALRRSRDAVARPASIPEAPGPSPPDGPEESGDGGLVFDPPEIDLGALEPAEPRRLSVRWSRRGAGPLKIRSAYTGCGCVVASGLPDAMPEGASGTMTIDFRGRTLPGPFAMFVRVVTDRPPADVQTVRLRGFVGSSIVVAPAALRLASVSPGHVVHRSATIRPPPSRLDVAIAATLEGVAGAAAVVDPAERGAVGWDVECSIVAPEAPGPFTGSLLIRAGDDSLWRIPIYGTVVGTVAPPAVPPPAATGGAR